MLSLRARKTLYLCAAIPASVLWIPVSLVGMAVLVGALGLLCIGSLLRCIASLPVASRPARVYYSATITLGMLLMVAFLVTSAYYGATHWPLLGSGIVLTIVGALVLLELLSSDRQR